MGRRYDSKEYEARILKIKQAFKDIFLYCDIIAGYPCETQENFKQSLAFLDTIGFAGLHVFSYSARQGTKAALMKQIPAAEIKRRWEILHQKDIQLRQKAAEKLVGTKQQFLGETFIKSNNCLSGVAANFQRILIPQGSLKTNFTQVKITKAKDGICYAQEI